MRNLEAWSPADRRRLEQFVDGLRIPRIDQEVVRTWVLEHCVPAPKEES